MNIKTPKSGTFEYIEAKIRSEAKDPYDKSYGKQFEKLCKYFLQTSPIYKNELKTVWLWNEWPGRWTDKDLGIDLVAKTFGGECWAIQAKCYDPKYSITKGDIDSFLAYSGRKVFSYRLLIATTNQIAYNARDTINGQEKPVGEVLRKDLLEADLKWPTNVTEKIKPLPPLKPLPHQIKAINEVVRKFKKSSKGQLIMACGTGKTFASIKIAEKINGKRILVLVPSLNLISQAIKDWARNHKKPFSMCVVCSDETVVKGEDAAVQTTAQLGMPPTTKPKQIKKFLSKRESNSKVIFCTYQSSSQIEKIQKKDCPAFDLVIADEAHRCAGLSGGGFGIVTNDIAIKSKKKLFMTATPRFISERLRKGAEEAGQEIISMCDKSKFGEVFHRLDFSEAIKRKILSDYQVVIMGVTEEKAKQFAVEGRIVEIGKELKTDARTLASQIGLAKAIQKYKLQKIITFHSTVAKAKNFGDADRDGSLVSVVDKLPKNIKGTADYWTRTIYGEMPVGKRSDYLAELKTLEPNSVGIISNCACLGEGVDVPTLDGIAFIDPKRSQVDIIQAVGRAIRKSENKEIGTIVIPVFIEEHENPDEILKSSAFDSVWAVIKALRSHDDLLADKLDEFRIRLGQKNKRISLPSKIKLHIPTKLHLPSFEKAFSVRTVEVSTTKWDAMIKLFKGYRKEHGDIDISKIKDDKYPGLRIWITHMRSERKQGVMTEERIAELDSLSFDWKHFGETIDDISGLISEKEVKKKLGLVSIDKYRKIKLIEPVGYFVRDGRLSAFYRPEQIEELFKGLGVTVRNNRGYLNEKQIYRKFKIGLKRFREKGLIKPAGFGFTNSGVSPLYKPEQIIKLKKDLGINLDDTSGLLSEFAFGQKFKFWEIAKYREKGLIKPKGIGISPAGTSYFYDESQIHELRKNLGITLLSTKGLLIEGEFKKQSGLTNLKNYRLEGKITPIGYALSSNGISPFYHPRQIKELKKELGITLSDTQGLIVEREFAKKIGVPNLGRYRVNGWVKPYGTAFAHSNFSCFYHPRQEKEIQQIIKKKLGITLDSTKGLLMASEIAKILGLSGIPKYISKTLKPYGYAMSKGGVRAFYHPDQIEELRKKLK